MTGTKQGHDYDRIASAIAFLRDRQIEQPSLGQLARHVGLSPHHLQRVFQRWAGVSPKRFLQFLTVEHAKRLLDESAPVLDAAFESGLSGPGRLHDQFVAIEAVTPGEYKNGGVGLTIRTGYHQSPFGMALVGLTDRGMCSLAFGRPGAEEELHADLQCRWPAARLVSSPRETDEALRSVFVASGRSPLSLIVRGTNFQIRVWRALLDIPAGQLISYGCLARRAGHPTAVRAVASAVGANPIAWLIPCHRVIRESGLLGGYRWGLDRKMAMIARESASRLVGQSA